MSAAAHKQEANRSHFTADHRAHFLRLASYFHLTPDAGALEPNPANFQSIRLPVADNEIILIYGDIDGFRFVINWHPEGINNREHNFDHEIERLWFVNPKRERPFATSLPDLLTHFRKLWTGEAHKDIAWSCLKTLHADFRITAAMAVILHEHQEEEAPP